MKRREKFLGVTLEQALAKVKKKFGEKALIIQTRYIEYSRFFGLKKQRWVEVEAEGEVQEEGFSKEAEELLRQTVLHILKRESHSSSEDALYEKLLAFRFSPAFAKVLMQDLASKTSTEEEFPHLLEKVLLRHIRTKKEPSQITSPRIWAFIGPTGVGKTTTIAKIAARFKLKKQASVGFCTLDTYRIGAVDQLRTYAQILDVPLFVVHKAEEVKALRPKLLQYDLVLVDTAGRSQRDRPKVKELSNFLKHLKPHEVHLVFSANTGHKCLSQLFQTFLPLGVNYGVITKLDEGSDFGNILSLLWENQLPVSYLTNGQEVPENLLEACPERIASLVTGTGGL